MPKRQPCVAYLRTSSLSSVGADKDSAKRQAEAVTAYAKANRLTIETMFYDPGVSGADPVNDRPGFVAMLSYMSFNGAKVILIENASRFARDLAVQLVGHDCLKGLGYDLIPVDAPDHFINETPTAEMVRQILGAVSQFEKASLVARLRRARVRKRAETGRCEGRKPPPPELVKEAKRLARKRPKGGNRSLRQIAGELAAAGFNSPTTGRAYSAEGIKQLLARA